MSTKLINVCSGCNIIDADKFCICPDILFHIYLKSYKINSIVCHCYINQKLFLGLIKWSSDHQRYTINWFLDYKLSFIQTSTYWGKLSLQYNLSSDLLLRYGTQITINNSNIGFVYDKELNQIMSQNSKNIYLINYEKNTESLYFNNKFQKNMNNLEKKYKEESITEQINAFIKRIKLIKNITNKNLSKKKSIKRCVRRLNKNYNNDVIFIKSIKNIEILSNNNEEENDDDVIFLPLVNDQLPWNESVLDNYWNDFDNYMKNTDLQTLILNGIDTLLDFDQDN